MEEDGARTARTLRGPGRATPRSPVEPVAATASGVPQPAPLSPPPTLAGGGAGGSPGARLSLRLSPPAGHRPPRGLGPSRGGEAATPWRRTGRDSPCACGSMARGWGGGKLCRPAQTRGCGGAARRRQAEAAAAAAAPFPRAAPRRGRRAGNDGATCRPGAGSAAHLGPPSPQRRGRLRLSGGAGAGEGRRGPRGDDGGEEEPGEGAESGSTCSAFTLGETGLPRAG